MNKPKKIYSMIEVNNILMVCLGNICRSPVAEGIMREKLKKYNLNIKVDSAGTAGYHIGENPDNRSVANAKKNGVDISKLKARQFNYQDFENFDVIYVMDKANRDSVLKMAKNEAQAKKVKLILSEHTSHNDGVVPDPYYGNEADFQLVFDLLDEVCEKIAHNFHLNLNSVKR